MKPFRKNVAIAIDGGGIKGLMVARALEILERELGKSLKETFRVTAGTSTGSIISAGIGMGMSGAQLTQLYRSLGPAIFRHTLRSRLWPLTSYRYSNEPIVGVLREHLGEHTRMGDLWSGNPGKDTDVIITVFDLVENRTRFVKSWKPEYRDWSLVTAVLSSSTVPTYFPVVEGRWADGGVGGYSNPCFLAAYEIRQCLPTLPDPSWHWDPAETTLISLGTGRAPHAAPPANRMRAWEWIGPMLGALLQSADDHAVHLVTTFYDDLDFRRFQVNLNEGVEMDDASPQALSALLRYGDELGQRILNNETDIEQQAVTPFRAIPRGPA